MLAIELVTADGRVVRADRDHEPELFWALRGGGGSFGVVTAIEFVLYPAPEVYAGAHALAVGAGDRGPQAPTSRGAGRRRTRSRRPRACSRSRRCPTSRSRSAAASSSRSTARTSATAEAAAEVLAPLRALEPEIDMFAPIPAAALSHIHMDPEHPVPGHGDGMILDDLTPAAIEALVASPARARARRC